MKQKITADTPAKNDFRDLDSMTSKKGKTNSLSSVANPKIEVFFQKTLIVPKKDTLEKALYGFTDVEIQSVSSNSRFPSSLIFQAI